MKLTTTRESLSKIWNAINNIATSRPINLHDAGRRLAREGWMLETQLEDALLQFYYSFRQEILDVNIFSDMLELPWQYAYYRPENRFDDPIGFKGLVATDAAAIFILLERLGFKIDAEIICSHLRGELREARLLTCHSIDILFHDKSQHRTPPVEMGTGPYEQSTSKSIKLKLPTGYRAECIVDETGSPCFLTVLSPKYRKRPEASSTTCDICGLTFRATTGSIEKYIGEN